MKKVLLLLCAFLGMINVHAQTNLSVAESFVKAISGQKYDEAVIYFDPSIKQVNKDVLESGWKQITGMFGDYKSYYIPKDVDANANHIVIGIHFANDVKGFSCNFNESHKMVGFLLAAAPQEGNEVAVPSRFQEEEVAVKVKDGTLKGTIMLPDHKNQFTPIVLIIAGSGPTDRNGNTILGKTNAYKLLAEALAAKGFATLRYDKRTVGGSNDFKTTEANLRFEDYVSDAKSMVSFLHDTRNYQSVYIAGHSEGSLVGMLAAQTVRTDGYISIAGAGENIADVLERQVNDKEATTIIEQLRKGKEVKNVPESMNTLLRPSVQPYLISWMKYDPAKEIKKLKVPVLILQGTTDIQVEVNDAKKLKAAHPTATLNIIEGMNHILKDAPADRTANIATYSNPSLPVNETLVGLMAGFMSAK